LIEKHYEVFPVDAPVIIANICKDLITTGSKIKDIDMEDLEILVSRQLLADRVK